jgi:TonB family protein
MTSAHQLLASMSSWLWPALLDHLWQGTLFAGVAWLFCLFAKRASSKTRYGIWLVASLKFGVPATLFVWLVAPLDIQVPWPREVVSSSPARVVTEFPLRTESEDQAVVIGPLETNRAGTEGTHTELYCSLTLVWVPGCLFFLWVWWHRHSTMKTRLRQAEPLVSGGAVEALQRVKTLLQERGPVTLLLSSDFPEPGVCGIRRPKLVLPKRLIDAFTDQELEAVFLHEVAHVRRRDNLVNLFQSCLGCMFWFHPMIWLINRQLLVEREGACDEEVLLHTPNCQEYLSSLLKVFRSSLGEKLAGASLITGSNLKRRIDHMRSHVPRRSSVAWHRLMVSGFVLAWIVSLMATAPANQRVLVAQQGLESSQAATTNTSEELPPAALKGVAQGVRGGVVGGIENGVAGGIAGGVKARSSHGTDRRAKQSSEPTLARAMNQTPASPAQQAGSARLFGTVSDASQARVPNATVVVSAREGGIKEITFSSAAGDYEFRALPLGHYSIEVRIAGFRPFRQALELHANEPRKLDVVLEVGEVAETVNVVAKATPAAPPDTRSGPPSRIRVGGNVQATKLVHRVNPVYPERAQAQGIQGTVLLEAVISKDGSLGALRVLNKLADPELVDAAVEAVKNWRYEPTLLNGQPIEVVTTITVNFRLASS